ncbi:MAG: hypothetical protein LBJ63_10845 [Prevotellaceae bacterium]|jgi:predicted metal-dependent hydrolase|nr:hypothetical protein [Prevotellaceae bacterium]
MRTKISEAIKKAFEPEYTFYRGFIADKINSVKDSFPLAWLNPPEMTDTNTYSCILYLMIKDSKYSEQEKENQWDQMENFALKAFREIIENDIYVKSIHYVRTFPNEYAYTGFGELSLKITFTVIVNPC